jgi:hypothetical protein
LGNLKRYVAASTLAGLQLCAGQVWLEPAKIRPDTGVIWLLQLEVSPDQYTLPKAGNQFAYLDVEECAPQSGQKTANPYRYRRVIRVNRSAAPAFKGSGITDVAARHSGRLLLTVRRRRGLILIVAGAWRVLYSNAFLPAGNCREQIKPAPM